MRLVVHIRYHYPGRGLCRLLWTLELAYQRRTERLHQPSCANTHGHCTVWLTTSGKALNRSSAEMRLLLRTAEKDHHAPFGTLYDFCLSTRMRSSDGTLRLSQVHPGPTGTDVSAAERENSYRFLVEVKAIARRGR